MHSELSRTFQTLQLLKFVSPPFITAPNHINAKVMADKLLSVLIPYSHFPAQVLTRSHRSTAQITSSQCLTCPNLRPIRIFYCFFVVDEFQSQCIKSHFPSQKKANPSSHLPLQDLHLINVCSDRVQVSNADSTVFSVHTTCLIQKRD